MRSTPERHRFVFLHGFTQTHHHWHAAAHRLGALVDSRPTLSFVDLPGHGLSGDDRAPIAAASVSLGSLAGRGTYVGYSMGGRYALHAAVAGDPAIERLVLIGATAGIDDAAGREERRRLDEQRAERVEHLGVPAFLDEWLAAPLFATLPADDAGRRARERNTATGLAHSLRSAGTGVQASLWAELERVGIPVLVLSGELDAKFTDIGARMAAALPRGTAATIAGAGHAAHLERPDEIAAAIAAWLGQSASPSANRAP